MDFDSDSGDYDADYDADYDSDDDSDYEYDDDPGDIDMEFEAECDEGDTNLEPESGEIPDIEYNLSGQDIQGISWELTHADSNDTEIGFPYDADDDKASNPDIYQEPDEAEPNYMTPEEMEAIAILEAQSKTAATEGSHNNNERKRYRRSRHEPEDYDFDDEDEDDEDEKEKDTPFERLKRMAKALILIQLMEEDYHE